MVSRSNKKNTLILNTIDADKSHLIDFSDFIISDRKLFRQKCSACLGDRGYQPMKCLGRTCNICKDLIKLKKNDIHGVVDFNDWIQKDCKKYRAKCHKCGCDRGYIEPSGFKKSCLSCACIKDKSKNVDYNDHQIIGTTRWYRQFCYECGFDKGYHSLASKDRRCKSCSKKYISILKTKRTKEHTKVKHAMSALLYVRLSKRGASKAGKRTFDILNYSFEDLVKHLESQFEPWMTWNNYGIYNKDRDTWNIDHIIPDSSFNYSSIEDDDFKKAWSLNNLRPILAHINIMKSDNI